MTALPQAMVLASSPSLASSLASWLPPGVRPAHAVALLGAAAAGLLLTRAVIALAPRFDLVSRPSGERHSTRPVPLGGGVALLLAMAPGLAWASLDLLVGACAVFLLGLIDDRRALPPAAKLAGQALAAGWMLAGPLDPGPPPLLLEGPAALVGPLTLAWYVGMANSVNLLDNMDGSAAGVSAVAGGVIALLAVGGAAPDPTLAVAACAFVGAALGFLAFNFPPARVFMGDAGSLPLGFVLAGLTVRLPEVGGVDGGAHGAAGGPEAVRDLVVAALVLGIPLFDTALVWLGRRAARRPFLQGGRDHVAHRLLALGLSERRTCLVLYGVAAALGGAGIAAARGDLGTAVTTCVAGGLAAVFAGVFLGDVAVYRTPEGDALLPGPAGRGRLAVLLVEGAVDALVLTAAWLGAYALRFEGVALPDTGQPALPFYLYASALPALPWVLACKLGALIAFDLYRGFWRTVRFEDGVALVKALSLATLLIVLGATVFDRFENYSRGVIAIDWLLSLAGVLLTRSVLRLLRDSLGRLAGTQRAALLAAPGLRPLVDLALTGDERFEVVAEVPPGDTAAVLAALTAAEVEVVLVAVPLAEEDPLLRALLGRGYRLRQVNLTVD